MTQHHTESADRSEAEYDPALPLGPLPGVESLFESDRPDLQTNFGNAWRAAAAACGSAPDLSEILAFQFSHGNSAVARTLIQRKVGSRSSTAPSPAPISNPAAPLGAPSAETPGTAAPTNEPRAPLIVEDNVETVEPGQMKKTEFLSQLRNAVCVAAEEELARTQWSVAGCPYLGPAFAHYATLDGPSLERIIRRYVGEAAAVSSASSLIPIVTGRVRRSVITWRNTGQVTGVPEGAVPGLPGVGMLGAIGGVASGAISGAADVISGAASAVGSAVSSVGSLLFKERNGGANDARDPLAVQSQLGAGHSLDAGIRSRMESAFGQSFGDVRVHTDAGGAALSENLNARAFTVGQHIAFGAGEYSPGTLIGDALIAHELAHVMQQGGRATIDGPAQKGINSGQRSPGPEDSSPNICF